MKIISAPAHGGGLGPAAPFRLLGGRGQVARVHSRLPVPSPSVLASLPRFLWLWRLGRSGRPGNKRTTGPVGLPLTQDASLESSVLRPFHRRWADLAPPRSLLGCPGHVVLGLSKRHALVPAACRVTGQWVVLEPCPPLCSLSS